MLRFCANVSWLFRELPFLERPDAARRAGFSGIEFHTPEGNPGAEIARAAAEAGITVVLINASHGDFLSGGSGLIGVPGREAEFREAVRQARELGEALGGVHVQIGQSRVPAGLARSDCMRVYLDNLRYAANELERGSCRALVEPMNATDLPDILVPDIQTALTAIAEAGDPRVGLQFDAYHCHMSGADVCSVVEELGSRIAHVQFSDAPGRGEPGTGHIDCSALFRTLDRNAFPHWVAAEYRPTRPTPETLDWLTTCLREEIRKLGRVSDRK